MNYGRDKAIKLVFHTTNAGLERGMSLDCRPAVVWCMILRMMIDWQHVNGPLSVSRRRDEEDEVS